MVVSGLTAPAGPDPQLTVHGIDIGPFQGAHLGHLQATAVQQAEKELVPRGVGCGEDAKYGRPANDVRQVLRPFRGHKAGANRHAGKVVEHRAEHGDVGGGP